MNLNEWRTIFITIGLLLIIIFIMPSLSSIFWEEENNNIAMAILNNDMLIDDYYPDNNLTIKIGDVLDWYIYIENNVDEIQYFAVKVKIVDGNVPPPNFMTCSYCQEPEIYEIRCLALNDQKIFKPFNFSILQANFGENFTIIEKIVINGVYFETDRELKPGVSIFLNTKRISPSTIKSKGHQRPRSVSLGEVQWCLDLSGRNKSCYGVGVKFPFPY